MHIGEKEREIARILESMDLRDRLGIVNALLQTDCSEGKIIHNLGMKAICFAELDNGEDFVVVPVAGSDQKILILKKFSNEEDLNSQSIFSREFCSIARFENVFRVA